MSQIQTLLKELEQEAVTTRKMLERVPAEKFSWKPHPKSGTLNWLSSHLAELPGWVKIAITTDELDFAVNPYTLPEINDIPQLLAFFESQLASGKAELENTTEEELEKPWTLRNGDYIIKTTTKAEMIKVAYCQTIHHRAQLGVYLRLLDVPIPGSYGPSADELMN